MMRHVVPSMGIPCQSGVSRSRIPLFSSMATWITFSRMVRAKHPHPRAMNFGERLALCMTVPLIPLWKPAVKCRTSHNKYFSGPSRTVAGGLPWSHVCQSEV